MLALSLAEWDRAVFLAINQRVHHPVLDAVMPYVTDLGLGHVQVLLLLLVAVASAWRAGELRSAHGIAAAVARALLSRSAWLGPTVAAVVLSGLAANALKADERRRPWWFYHLEHRRGRFVDVQVRLVPGQYPGKVRGFPSGHTATSVGIACTLQLLRRRLGLRRRVLAALWIGAGAIAFSRVYLASHWPLDIVGGAAFGVAGAVASVVLLRRVWARIGEPGNSAPEAQENG